LPGLPDSRADEIAMSASDLGAADDLITSGFEPAPGRSGRRRTLRSPRGHRSLPYLLIVPSLAVLLGIFGYPAVYLVRISFQQFDLPQLFGSEPTKWIGFDNYVEFITGDNFIPIVIRTLAFTTACVVLTIGLGLLIALLMQRISSLVRIPLLIAMMFAWAMPPISAVAVFGWLVDYQTGVLNWLIDQLPGVDFSQHNWFINPIEGFSVIVAMIVWGAIPFVAITFYAALTQVPHELIEAARIDGAGRWAVFRNVVYPVIKPVVIIATTLSIIWDFQVIVQILAMLDGTPNEDYFTLPIYSYMTSIVGGYYGLGAAAAVIMILGLIGLSFFYIRQVLRIQEIDS
jgi:N,N'-diacetylchitobiose transport system permease protein